LAHKDDSVRVCNKALSYSPESESQREIKQKRGEEKEGEKEKKVCWA